MTTYKFAKEITTGVLETPLMWLRAVYDSRNDFIVAMESRKIWKPVLKAMPKFITYENGSFYLELKVLDEETRKITQEIFEAPPRAINQLFGSYKIPSITNFLRFCCLKDAENGHARDIGIEKYTEKEEEYIIDLLNSAIKKFFIPLKKVRVYIVEDMFRKRIATFESGYLHKPDLEIFLDVEAQLEKMEKELKLKFAKDMELHKAIVTIYWTEFSFINMNPILKKKIHTLLGVTISNSEFKSQDKGAVKIRSFMFLPSKNVSITGFTRKTIGDPIYHIGKKENFNKKVLNILKPVLGNSKELLQHYDRFTREEVVKIPLGSIDVSELKKALGSKELKPIEEILKIYDTQLETDPNLLGIFYSVMQYVEENPSQDKRSLFRDKGTQIIKNPKGFFKKLGREIIREATIKRMPPEEE